MWVVGFRTLNNLNNVTKNLGKIKFNAAVVNKINIFSPLFAASPIHIENVYQRLKCFHINPESDYQFVKKIKASVRKMVEGPVKPVLIIKWLHNTDKSTKD